MQTENDFEKAYEKNSIKAEKDIVPLKALKRKMRKNKLLTIAVSFLSAIAFVGSLFFLLVIYGMPTHSEKIKLATEFQYNDGAYLDQSFALNIMSLDGMPLSIDVKNVYETDACGKKILVGYEIIPRAVAFNLGQHPGSFMIGYSYPGDTAPNENFDFTITIKFKDRTIVYSMVEEGLFVSQDNVVDYFDEKNSDE